MKFDDIPLSFRIETLSHDSHNSPSACHRELSRNHFCCVCWFIACCTILASQFVYTSVALPQHFRTPNIPGSKSLDGKSIQPATQISTQDNLVPIRSAPVATEKPEYIFPSQTGGRSQGRLNGEFLLGHPVAGERTTEQQLDEQTLNDFLRSQERNQFERTDSGFESLPQPMSDSPDARTPNGLEVIKQRYPDGKPRIIRHVAQDKEGNYFNHGPWEVLNKAGQVIASGTYKNGLMHGQWKRQHATESGGMFGTKPFDLFQGPFLSVARFKNGKLEGLWTIYDQYRQKIFEIPYQDGIRHGIANWYYPNGAKMREATFKKGLIDGEILNWNDGEKLVSREQYVDGRKIVRNTTFYRPNAKKSENYFLGSKLEPEDRDDWWKAKPTPFLPSGREVQNGPSMSWYANGQPKKRGQYKDDQPVGKFIWWHENGNKHIEGFYVKGKKARRWTWWFENGMKKVEGAYRDDQPTGNWRSWHSDGDLRNQKDYSADEESGDDTEPDNDAATGDEVALPENDQTDLRAENEDLPEMEIEAGGELSNEPTMEELPLPLSPDSESVETDEEELEDISSLTFRSPRINEASSSSAGHSIFRHFETEPTEPVSEPTFIEPTFVTPTVPEEEEQLESITPLAFRSPTIMETSSSIGQSMFDSFESDEEVQPEDNSPLVFRSPRIKGTLSSSAGQSVFRDFDTDEEVQPEVNTPPVFRSPGIKDVFSPSADQSIFGDFEAESSEPVAESKFTEPTFFEPLQIEDDEGEENEAKSILSTEIFEHSLFERP